MYRIVTNELIRRRNLISVYDNTIAWTLEIPANTGITFSFQYIGEGLVNYGDGNYAELPLKTSMYNHAYTYPQQSSITSYTTVITGNITRIRTYTNKEYIKTIHSLSIPGYIGNNSNNLSGEFYECINADLDPKFKFASSMERLYGTFRGCKSITVLPLVPSDFTGTISEIFFDCEIATLPPGFKIPAGVTFLKGAFQWCFNLGDISNVWPVGGFTQYGVDVREIFAMNKSGASNNISGIVPGNLLWERPSSRFNGTTSAFSRCTGLTNYSSIPAAWGGGGA